MSEKPKYSIDDLRKLEPDHRQAREQLEEELASLQSKKEQLQAEYMASVEKGHVEALRPLREKQDAIQDEILVKKTSLEKNSRNYDPKEVRSSWNAYCGAYNEAFAKKVSEYHLVRKKLAELFLALAEMQRQVIVDACHVNRLYSETEPVFDKLAACDSDLMRPTAMSGYTEKRETIIPAQSIAGYVLPPAKKTETVELFVKALTASGDIPAEMAPRLTAVICDGLPISKL